MNGQIVDKFHEFRLLNDKISFHCNIFASKFIQEGLKYWSNSPQHVATFRHLSKSLQRHFSIAQTFQGFPPGTPAWPDPRMRC